MEVALGDGRLLIALTGISLVLAGGFAILQSASGHLLPQDSHAIGMDAAALARAANGRLLGFMFHDRVAYGGTLLSIGAGYLWIAGFPLCRREAWAWWALLVSGTIGFLAFLTYLGQGYLDSWHGVATLFLLPVFIVGMRRSYPAKAVWNSQLGAAATLERAGRLLLACCAAGLILAGATIAVFGMTRVFVPSDLRFIGVDAQTLKRISPMLIPVIAHDRAGFGGGLCSMGCLLIYIARYAELNRSLVEIVIVMGLAGFGTAIGVHFMVGYRDFMHLLPAFAGFFLFFAAATLLGVSWRRQLAGSARAAAATDAR